MNTPDSTESLRYNIDVLKEWCAFLRDDAENQTVIDALDDVHSIINDYMDDETNGELIHAGNVIVKRRLTELVSLLEEGENEDYFLSAAPIKKRLVKTCEVIDLYK